jgi:hypothetical protein
MEQAQQPSSVQDMTATRTRACDHDYGFFSEGTPK